MCEIPVFRDADFANLEFVRHVVLRRLKDDADWHQFDRTWDERNQAFVRFEEPRLRPRFITLSNEIMWQLIIQGVITVGMNSDNPNLPWFRITDYGQKVLDAERLIPHDPTGYLDELRGVAGPLDISVMVSYVEEALACFVSGCNVAATLLLGVAAESVFNELCSAIQPTMADPNERSNLDLTRQVRPRHRWLVTKYQNLSAAQRRQLPESLDVTLTSLYDLIRRQRNELGHPQATPPQVTREVAFVHFQMLPTYLIDMQAFATYCAHNGI